MVRRSFESSPEGEAADDHQLSKGYKSVPQGFLTTADNDKFKNEYRQ